MKPFYFIALFFFASVSLYGQNQLVWSDEFDGSTVNTNYWNFDIGTGAGGWGNNESQYYTSRPENVKVENGKLVITALLENYGGKSYTSARLNTKTKINWKYGRIEMKAKLPKGKGTWPAFWMLPEQQLYGTNYWPDNGEIDIMEYVGYQPGVIHGSVHTHQNYAGNSITRTITYSGVEDDFHVYAIEWASDMIKFYVDSYYYGNYYRSGQSWNYWPFDQNFFLLINLAIGGNWGGAQGIDNTIFPQTYEIDYIRVYSLSTDAKTVDFNNDISVFPNPTSDKLYLNVQNAGNFEYQVIVYDLMGKVVIPQSTYHGNKSLIDLHELKAGLYFLNVRMDNESRTFKIVKE